MNAQVTGNSLRSLRVMHVLLTMGVGGAEKLVYDMIRHHDPAVVSSSVCCIQAMGPLGDKLRESGVPVFFYERKQGIDWAMIGWLRKLIVSEKINLLHAHQYTPMFYTVLAAAGLSGVRVVYTEHGRQYPEKWNWKRYLFNPLLALGIDHIVSIAESTRQAMVYYDNFPANKIRVIHNGIDFETFRTTVDVAAKRSELGLNETDRIVGTAARLEEIKNLPMMLRAFKRVLVAQPDTILLIAGIGSQEKPLKKLAAELGIADRVKFLGLCFDLPEIYPLLEVFLLTSFTEGISITLLEAMANGAPVVVTDVGGNPEVVVDGVNGYLVRSDDDSALASKILDLLKHPECAQQMGQRAIKRIVLQFQFQIMMDNYKGLYEQ